MNSNNLVSEKKKNSLLFLRLMNSDNSENFSNLLFIKSILHPIKSDKFSTLYINNNS